MMPNKQSHTISIKIEMVIAYQQERTQINFFDLNPGKRKTNTHLFLGKCGQQQTHSHVSSSGITQSKCLVVTHQKTQINFFDLNPGKRKTNTHLFLGKCGQQQTHSHVSSSGITQSKCLSLLHLTC